MGLVGRQHVHQTQHRHAHACRPSALQAILPSAISSHTAIVTSHTAAITNHAAFAGLGACKPQAVSMQQPARRLHQVPCSHQLATTLAWPPGTSSFAGLRWMCTGTVQQHGTFRAFTSPACASAAEPAPAPAAAPLETPPIKALAEFSMQGQAQQQAGYGAASPTLGTPGRAAAMHGREEDRVTSLARQLLALTKQELEGVTNGGQPASSLRGSNSPQDSSTGQLQQQQQQQHLEQHRDRLCVSLESALLSDMPR